MKPEITKTRYLWILVATAALLVALLAQPALADKFWVGPNPNNYWTNDNNWSNTSGGPPGAGQPVAGENIFLTQSDAINRTVLFNTAANLLYGDLRIDATGTGTMTFQKSGNPLSADHETVGFDGTGTFNHDTTTNTVSTLFLGYNATGNGTYNLNSGSLSAGFEEVGVFGTGTFNQNSGTNIISNFLVIGNQAHSNGTFNLKSGSLSANFEFIGSGGTGTFNQFSGSNTVTTDMSLADMAGSNGTYNKMSGFLSVGRDLLVGTRGTGSFTQTGNVTTGRDLNVSRFTTNGTLSVGTYKMSSGILTVGGDENVGWNGTGTLTQDSGINSITGNLFIGRGPNTDSSGTFTLSSGTLHVGLNEIVGREGNGTFTQSSGIHTVDGNLVLAQNTAGKTGTFTLESGSLNVGGNEIIGNSGIGVFNQTGGTHKVTNTLTLAANAGSSGTYNFKGGTLSTGAIQINAGGTFNVTGINPTIPGNVTNSGTVKTTNAKVTWSGTFTNNGAYISDPSTQTFSQDLVVNSTGYLVGNSPLSGTGNPQDLFVFKNDFVNQSTQNALWNTANAEMKFITGPDTSHTLSIAGDGSTAGHPFSWYTLDISGQTLHLKDGDATANGAQWLQVLIGAKFTGTTLTNIFNDDASNVLNLYYDKNLAANAYLKGLDYTITGGANGMLIAHTPLPPSVLLLGSGLLGMGLLGWRRKRS